MKLPPFGNTVNNHIVIFLFMGFRAYKDAKKDIQENETNGHATLCLPPWVSSLEYSWPVKGCAILIYDSGGGEPNYVSDLIKTLFFYEASYIHYVSPEKEQISFTRKRINKNEKTE